MGDDQERVTETEEQRFNETLKRMLKTPPKPHEKPAKKEPPSQHSKPLSKKR